MLQEPDAMDLCSPEMTKKSIIKTGFGLGRRQFWPISAYCPDI